MGEIEQLVSKLEGIDRTLHEIKASITIDKKGKKEAILSFLKSAEENKNNWKTDKSAVELVREGRKSKRGY